MNINQQLFTACKATTCSLTLALFFCGCAVAQAVGPPKPACLTPGSDAKNIEIVIAADSEPAFAGGSTGKACPGGPYNNPGDICMSINEKPDIKFTKTGADKDEWEFLKIELSGNNVDWPGTLPAGAYSDFEFGSDTALNTGQPYWSKQGDSMHVQNNNCHDFTVYYRLILKNGTTGDEVTLHPIMDNTGTGSVSVSVSASQPE